MSTSLKIVPDAEPNADGEWLAVKRNIPDDLRGWRALEEFFADRVPAGFHLVAVDAARFVATRK